MNTEESDFLKITDIRLGNFINCFGIICVVVQTDLRSSYIEAESLEKETYNSHIRDAVGIPLTKNIINVCKIHADFRYNFYEYFNEIIFHKIAYTEFGFDELEIVALKYLHQLQNYVHIITGEELIIDMIKLIDIKL